MKVFRRFCRLCCYFEESREVGTGWPTELTSGGDGNIVREVWQRDTIEGTPRANVNMGNG